MSWSESTFQDRPVFWQKSGMAVPEDLQKSFSVDRSA